MQIKSKQQAFAMTNKYKSQWKQLYPSLTDECGIYILTRQENGIKYAYIGQAKHILTRLAQHMFGHQWIDLSIQRHKLYSDTNIVGWKLEAVKHYELDTLDHWENYYIKEYANKGYQLRNQTAGGQIDRVGMEKATLPRGYYDGVRQGEKNIIKELKAIIDRYLIIGVNKEGKLPQKMLAKFNSILEIEGENNVKENGNSVATQEYKHES